MIPEGATFSDEDTTIRNNGVNSGEFVENIELVSNIGDNNIQRRSSDSQIQHEDSTDDIPEELEEAHDIDDENVPRIEDLQQRLESGNDTLQEHLIIQAPSPPTVENNVNQERQNASLFSTSEVITSDSVISLPPPDASNNTNNNILNSSIAIESISSHINAGDNGITPVDTNIPMILRVQTSNSDRTDLQVDNKRFKRESTASRLLSGTGSGNAQNLPLSASLNLEVREYEENRQLSSLRRPERLINSATSRLSGNLADAARVLSPTPASENSLQPPPDYSDQFRVANDERSNFRRSQNSISVVSADSTPLRSIDSSAATSPNHTSSVQGSYQHQSRVPTPALGLLSSYSATTQRSNARFNGPSTASGTVSCRSTGPQDNNFLLPPPYKVEDLHYPPSGPDCLPGCGYTGLPCYMCSSKVNPPSSIHPKHTYFFSRAFGRARATGGVPTAEDTAADELIQQWQQFRLQNRILVGTSSPYPSVRHIQHRRFHPRYVGPPPSYRSLFPSSVCDNCLKDLHRTYGCPQSKLTPVIAILFIIYVIIVIHLMVHGFNQKKSKEYWDEEY